MSGKYQVRIEITFCSGHRIMGHLGKCIFPHGHTYTAEIWISGNSLNRMGFVVDFSDLKDNISSWIDKYWDHAFLLNSQDKVLLDALNNIENSRIFTFDNKNPSAEVMASEIYHRTYELCDIEPTKVRVWESPTQYAEYSRNL